MCPMLVKNELSFSPRSSKCGSSVTGRIDTAGGAEPGGCVPGSSDQNGAGDCGVVCEGTERVSDGLRDSCPPFLR